METHRLTNYKKEDRPTNINAIISVTSVCIAFISVLFVILNYAKGNEREHDDGVESRIRMNVKLDQISATTASIQTDIKAMQKNYSELDKRVVIVERDLNTAFIRIDELRESIKSEQEEKSK